MSMSRCIESDSYATLFKVADAISLPALAFTNHLSTLRSNFSASAEPRLVIVAVALVCILFLDLYHLVFMVLGASFFCVLQSLQLEKKKTKPLNHSVHDKAGVQKGRSPMYHVNRPSPSPNSHSITARKPATWERPSGLHHPAASRERHERQKVQTPETRRRVGPTSVPIEAPTFNGSGWDQEVDELLCRIQPTQECDKGVEHLALLVKQTLGKLIPNLEVVGFANGDLRRGKAFGVAVPDVDIVITASIHQLAAVVRGRAPGGHGMSAKSDALKVQKSAIRSFTEQLVWGGGFKFRRSSFRGLEPKVTLLSPASIVGFQDGIPIDLYVNARTPLYTAVLVHDASRLERRAMDLVSLVRRWAKDRGVCHAARGHLPPYVWNVLAIFFLQAHADCDGACLLPPFEQFPLSHSLFIRIDYAHIAKLITSTRSLAATQRQNTNTNISVGKLLREFFHFYGMSFDWHGEAISIRRTSGLAGVSVPKPKGLEVAPSIEDPFMPTRNLGMCMTPTSSQRLKEELIRAHLICNRGDASLTELLEPWVPAEAESSEGAAHLEAIDDDA